MTFHQIDSNRFARFALSVLSNENAINARAAKGATDAKEKILPLKKKTKI